LYLLILALPISGWLMSSASAYSVSWFNLVELPDLVAPSPTLKEALVSVHHTLATGLWLVASLHLLAALKHRFFNHDDVLGRMLTGTTGAAFVIVLSSALWISTDVRRSGAEAAASAPQPAATPRPKDARPLGPDSNVAPWQIDYPASHIHFSAEQAGAGFEGAWQTWRGDIRFLPEALATSRAVIEVDVASVATGDSERDETLLSAGWFSANAFPTVTFTADQFVADGDGRFTAAATLTVKNASTPVQFLFSVARNESGEGWILDGSTRLDRLALRLGMGEWADPTWVGQFVEVSVHVEARAQP
jgi:polyisoprenoid-binding protein YceI